MAITPSQRESRKRYIGSSDIASIIGVPGAFQTAGDLFIEKLGLKEPGKENESMRMGNLFEPPILQWAEEELQEELTNYERDITVISADGVCAANLDSCGTSRESGETRDIEAKLTRADDQWGEPNTDAVPDRVNLQVHFASYCIGTKTADGIIPGTAHVAALMPFLNIQIYRIQVDRELCLHLAAEAARFLNRVRSWKPGDEIPGDLGPTVESLQRIRRIDGITAHVADDILDRYRYAVAMRKMLDEKIKSGMEPFTAEEETAKANLLAAMGVAKGAKTESGRFVKLKEIKNKGYTVQPFAYNRIDTLDRNGEKLKSPIVPTLEIEFQEKPMVVDEP